MRSSTDVIKINDSGGPEGTTTVNGSTYQVYDQSSSQAEVLDRRSRQQWLSPQLA